MIQTLYFQEDQRVFFVGDVHGERDKFLMSLREANFDFDRDICISLGDLIDKGSDSLGALRLTEAQWLKTIEGNHEEDAWGYLESSCGWQGKDWMQHGGDWFFNLNEDEKQEAKKLLLKLKRRSARVIEVMIGDKRFIGTHADLNIKTWDRNSVTDLASHKDFTRCRSLAQYIKHGRSDLIPNLDGVDAHFCGHTPFSSARSFKNRHWLDTAAYKREGRIALAEVTYSNIVYH